MCVVCNNRGYGHNDGSIFKFGFCFPSGRRWRGRGVLILFVYERADQALQMPAPTLQQCPFTLPVTWATVVRRTCIRYISCVGFFVS